jgi:antitoxin (DNA-binding transcriptional repressor) of toxin-antitoxin stability system
MAPPDLLAGPRQARRWNVRYFHEVFRWLTQIHCQAPIPAVAGNRGPGVGRLCRTTCYSRSMSREVTQRELRNESGKIMRELDEGETFIVTRNGIPVGELAPLRRHRFVAAETAVALFKTAPAVDYARFRADLDNVASQDATPRG